MYEKIISRSVIILLCLTVLLNNVGLSEPKTNRIARVISFHYFLTYTMYRTILVIVKNLCWVFNGNIRLESPNPKKGFKNVFIFMYVVFFRFLDPKLKQKRLVLFCSNLHNTCILNWDECIINQSRQKRMYTSPKVIVIIFFP